MKGINTSNAAQMRKAYEKEYASPYQASMRGVNTSNATQVSEAYKLKYDKEYAGAVTELAAAPQVGDSTSEMRAEHYQKKYGSPYTPASMKGVNTSNVSQVTKAYEKEYASEYQASMRGVNTSNASQVSQAYRLKYSPYYVELGAAASQAGGSTLETKAEHYQKKYGSPYTP